MRQPVFITEQAGNNIRIQKAAHTKKKKEDEENKMKKWMAICLTAVITMGALTGCGNDSGNLAQGDIRLEGNCEEILTQVYADAALNTEMKEAMEYYQMTEVAEDSKEYILGTSDIAYTDSVYSAPMMSSIAYQCVLLRVADGQDIETAKQLLVDNADPIKWVCVEAESVVVENVGDVILYVMADAESAEAIKTAFLALAE